MPKTGKFKRSWLLFTAAVNVLFHHKKLLLFPLITSVFMIAIILFFAAPVVLMPTGHSIFQTEHWKAVEQRIFEHGPTQPLRDGVGQIQGGEDAKTGAPARDFHPKTSIMIYLAIFYLAAMFIATYSNVAFANEILKALNGGDVSITSGIRFAWSRLSSILVWSLFAGSIGLAISILERRFGWLGKLGLRLVGVVWSVASVFAIPIIVRNESRNPIQLLRQSASTLRKTWGETLIGFVGLQMGLLILPATLVVSFLMSVALKIFNAPGIFAAGLFVWSVSVIGIAYVGSVAGQIYRCALYIYASEGVAPGPYSPEMMDMAWRIKKTAG